MAKQFDVLVRRWTSVDQIVRVEAETPKQANELAKAQSWDVPIGDPNQFQTDAKIVWHTVAKTRVVPTVSAAPAAPAAPQEDAKTEDATDAVAPAKPVKGKAAA